jgi:uncharacterized membrane protein
MEAFTDAVIAIIMTILVLDFNVPSEPTFEALWALRFKFLVYILSFALLAIYWNNHHHMLQVSKKVNGKVLWRNMALILCLTFFPFVSAWVDDHPFAMAPEITFGMVVLLADISWLALARSLAQANETAPEAAKAIYGYRKSCVTIIIVVAGIVAGFFIPAAVIVSIAVSLCMWAVPSKRIETHMESK